MDYLRTWSLSCPVPIKLIFNSLVLSLTDLRCCLVKASLQLICHLRHRTGLYTLITSHHGILVPSSKCVSAQTLPMQQNSCSVDETTRRDGSAIYWHEVPCEGCRCRKGLGGKGKGDSSGESKVHAEHIRRARAGPSNHGVASPLNLSSSAAQFLTRVIGTGTPSTT